MISPSSTKLKQFISIYPRLWMSLVHVIKWIQFSFTLPPGFYLGSIKPSPRVWVEEWSPQQLSEEGGGRAPAPSIHHPLSSIQYYCNHCYYAPLQRSTLMKHMRGRIDHLNNFPNTMFHHQLPSIILWKSSKIQVRPELIRYYSISASTALC